MRIACAALIFFLGPVAGNDEKPIAFEEIDFPIDEKELVRILHQNIVSNLGVTEELEMSDYISEIPQTGEKYEMVAIKGGEFFMGSPPEEEGRSDDEGPQHRVRVSPFWMGRFEVTWDQYEPFMLTPNYRRKDGSLVSEKDADSLAAVVSAPTTPYTEMSFGMGSAGGFPAICMTQHAASKFCQWLSAQTGNFYRLPTEAEWEYACRAGSKTAFWYGDDPDRLIEYDIVDPRGKRVGYEKVGVGKPNPWGLYDMHGSVMEWCLDGYVQDAYSSRVTTGGVGEVFKDPLVIATQRYPRVARGGSWYDYPKDCRSAARMASEPAWQVQDPQEPTSLWYLSDAIWLGFRIVRPLEVPSADEMYRSWNSGGVHHKE